MPQLDFLTDEYVYRVASDGKATQAALKLLDTGAFRDPKRSADGIRLNALCQGSEVKPYKVHVDLGDPNLPLMKCTCDSYKHPCKHTLGLLFLAIRSPELFAQDTSVPPSGRKRKITRSTAFARAAADEKEAPADLGEALVQAIIADPEEDAPRLIYADWLDEQGAPAEQARAEFIRIQIELARLTEDDPRTRKLVARENKLWKQHCADWMKCVPQHLRNRGLRFHRGFLEEMTLRPESWVNQAEDLFALNPIYRFRLPGAVDRHRAGFLAVIPQLTHIRVLDLSGCTLHDGSKSLQILLATPFLSHLKRLHLRQCAITTREVGVIIDSPVLPHLQVLDLAGNQIGPRGGEALASSDRVTSLKELSLADNPLGDAGARALCQSPYLDGLTRLDLSGVALGKTTQAALRQRFGDRVLL